MELKDIREKIDQIDDKIAKLYAERMECVKDVIDAKKQSGKAVLTPTEKRTLFCA